jgi:hypothetical protein
VEELGGALCRCRWEEVFKCAMASSEVVLLVSREVQWLLTTAGWPGSGSSSGEALALLARGRTQNVVTIEPHLIAIYISH